MTPTKPEVRDPGEGPLFSVITPVYKTPLKHLRQCIESVRRQTFTDWEHILVDDGSGDPGITAELRKAAARDPRVRLYPRAVNGGIVAASNDALAHARGEWIALLDHDDMLKPDALEAMAEQVRGDDDVVLVYSDWERITEDGQYVDTFPKPAWSPERLAGNMYLIHLTVMRTSRVREVGGFRDGFAGSQDHDLALRVTEGGGTVKQIKRILYQWRMIPTSTAADPDSKPYARIAGVRAAQEHFDRLGLDASVRESGQPGLYVVDRRPKPGSLASIVIPTRGTPESVFGRPAEPLVVNAVRSMLAHRQQVPMEFVIVYDTGVNTKYLQDLQNLADGMLRPVPYDKPFNFSEKVNLGALHARGDIVVFANDDLELISEHWLDQLVAIAQQPDVGSVGALLLFEDGTVQHAGHTYVRGAPTHAYLGARADELGLMGDLILEHEVPGVTAALLACRKAVWEEVGGFSPAFPGNYNDVDFCLKVRRAGYRIVVSPQVRAWHFESRTRDASVQPGEIEMLHARWGPQLQEDPWLRSPAPRPRGKLATRLRGRIA